MLAGYVYEPVLAVFKTGDISTIMILECLLFLIAVIWLAAASVSDIKKREVANWLSFSLIAIAISIRAAQSVAALNADYVINGAIGLVAFLVLANALYYTKVIAGGDAKLLIALGIIFSAKPSIGWLQAVSDPLNLPFPLIFLLDVLLVASVYGIIYSMGLALKNSKEFLGSFKKIYRQTAKIRMPLMLVLFISLVTLFLNRAYEMFFLVAIIFVFPYLYMFVKAVENSCMIKLTAASNLTEGDWIVNSVSVGKRIIKPNVEGLSQEEISILRKAGKKVVVKQGIPFVPVFLISTIAALFFGNLFSMVALWIIG